MQHEFENIENEELSQFLDNSILEYPDNSKLFWISELSSPLPSTPTKLERNFLTRNEEGFSLKENAYYHTQYTFKNQQKRGFFTFKNKKLMVLNFEEISSHFNLPNREPTEYYELTKLPIQVNEHSELHIINVSDKENNKTEVRIFISLNQIKTKENKRYIPSWLYEKIIIKIKEQSGLSSPNDIKNNTDQLIIEPFIQK